MIERTTEHYEGAIALLEETIARLEVNLANARLHITWLEDEILDCPAKNYHAPGYDTVIDHSGSNLPPQEKEEKND